MKGSSSALPLFERRREEEIFSPSEVGLGVALPASPAPCCEVEEFRGNEGVDKLSMPGSTGLSEEDREALRSGAIEGDAQEGKGYVAPFLSQFFGLIGGLNPPVVTQPFASTVLADSDSLLRPPVLLRSSPAFLAAAGFSR